MSNIGLIKQARNIFHQVSQIHENLPGIVVLKRYRELLEQFYGPGGSHTDMVLLYDYEINKLILNTDIDVSVLSMSDIESVEFKDMLEEFVLCIGVTFVTYKKISPSFHKEDLIMTITRRLTLEFV